VLHVQRPPGPRRCRPPPVARAPRTDTRSPSRRRDVTLHERSRRSLRAAGSTLLVAGPSAGGEPLSEVGGGGASSVAAVRRPPRVPGWLIEVARPARGPVPWGGMGLAALAIGVPVAVGLAVGHTVQGVLIAVGGLVGALADRPGPYPMRVRRIAIAGVFGGVAGLLVGTGINGRGWLVVAVLIVVAGVSALLSSISAIWSTAGLFLLAYAALATGPLGALRPWWLPPLWLLTGVGWTLVLLVPGWLSHPRAAEQREVASVYRALAANLRALGTEEFDAARQGVTTALNAAYEGLLGQRAAGTDGCRGWWPCSTRADWQPKPSRRCPPRGSSPGRKPRRRLTRWRRRC
jgi:hypothetical protein